MAAVAKAEVTGVEELEKALSAMSDRMRSIENRQAAQDALNARLREAGQAAATRAEQGLFTVTKEDAIYGTVGGAVGVGTVYALSTQGIVALNPLNMTIGGAAGLAIGVGVSRFRQ
jgi:hypothetical protein